MYKIVIRRRGSNELQTLVADAACARASFIMHEDRTWSPATNLSLRIPVNAAKEVDLGNPPGEEVEVLMVYDNMTNEGETAMIRFAQTFGRREVEVAETIRQLQARSQRAALVTANGWH